MIEYPDEKSIVERSFVFTSSLSWKKFMEHGFFFPSFPEDLILIEEKLRS